MRAKCSLNPRRNRVGQCNNATAFHSEQMFEPLPGVIENDKQVELMRHGAYVFNTPLVASAHILGGNGSYFCLRSPVDAPEIVLDVV